MHKANFCNICCTECLVNEYNSIIVNYGQCKSNKTKNLVFKSLCCRTIQRAQCILYYIFTLFFYWLINENDKRSACDS